MWPASRDRPSSTSKKPLTIKNGTTRSYRTNQHRRNLQESTSTDTTLVLSKKSRYQTFLPTSLQARPRVPAVLQYYKYYASTPRPRSDHLQHYSTSNNDLPSSSKGGGYPISKGGGFPQLTWHLHPIFFTANNFIFYLSSWISDLTYKFSVLVQGCVDSSLLASSCSTSVHTLCLSVVHLSLTPFTCIYYLRFYVRYEANRLSTPIIISWHWFRILSSYWLATYVRLCN